MNERIKELALQAGFNPYNYEGANAALFKKFAELIVRECISKLDNIGVIDRDSRTIAMKVISKHFDVGPSIKVGSRIQVLSGFNVGAKGTVSYVEPSGKLWVMRDGASSDVFYHPEELVGIKE